MSVGGPFADFDMIATSDGKKIGFSQIAGNGKPVVLMVYSSTIRDCVPAVQSLEEMAFSHSHVVFVIMNVEDSVPKTREFLKSHGIKKCKSFNGRLPQGYNAREGALPYHVVIDEEGKVLLASEDANGSFIDLVA